VDIVFADPRYLFSNGRSTVHAGDIQILINVQVRSLVFIDRFMTDEIQIKKSSINNLRKKYHKAGRRWEAEDDALLQEMYRGFRSSSGGDFDKFLGGLVKDFGRTSGGLKARLAKYFNDVPGWDYERDKSRQEELNNQAEEAIPQNKNRLLSDEYQKYVKNKAETYINFLKRVSGGLGAERKLVSHRLRQLVGDIEKFGREDIKSKFASRRLIASENFDVSQIDLVNNLEMSRAFEIMEETSDNLFLTGEAGTGKSTLLKYFRASTKKNIVILAPTGVAALNVDGQTIHSFCGFGPDITLSKVKKLRVGMPKFKMLQKLQTIVIDEISMVRADLLDCLEKFLRLNGSAPMLLFGGIQMVLIGDLHQLPPVEKDFQKVNPKSKYEKINFLGLPGGNSGHSSTGNLYASPYFFDAPSFCGSKFDYVRLKTAYRQQDPVFLGVLNAVRNNTVTTEHLKILNHRARSQEKKFTFEKFAVYLTPHNAQAGKVNGWFLSKLKSPLKVYTGRASGNFKDRALPTDLDLQVKVGAQVMMLNNDARKRWVNGTMGKIVGTEENTTDDTAEDRDTDEIFEDCGESSSENIVIELETGETVYIQPFTWEMFKFVLDKGSNRIDSQTMGTFTQYPFKLAWAVTIHKAQGKTFDKVYIDLSTGTFAHGQLYVALSRCRSLEGLYLKRPVFQDDIILDERILEFLQKFEKGNSLHPSCPHSHKTSLNT